LRLVVGARYDRVDVSLASANEVIPGSGRTPNDLYRQYYGVSGSDRAENNLGGLAFLEYELTGSTVLSFGFSRSVRTADATERSMASDQGPNSWVGNPTIDPEAHHQAEAGVDMTGKDWRLFGNVYADWVNDFIMRDRARGQDGILLSNGASVYRNVDALLTGFTIGGQYRFGGNWVIDANAAYTFGENVSDSRALSQIPPLEGMVSLTFKEDGWSLGGTLRGAIQQTRVDDDPATGSGLDVGQTPG
jgi:iron complex outermembrane recepter protein